MSSVERFEDLQVWQRARELANLVYDLSATEVFARDFGLKDQMRRAAISIMSNIAEGFESRTQLLFIEFLGRAKGSAGELRAQLYLARDREYLRQEDFTRALVLADGCSRQIYRLMAYLEAHPEKRRLKEVREEWVLDQSFDS
jgi:four helix bundle protein